MLGRKSYADPIKQTWRGWQWNQICRRLPEWDGMEMPSIQSAEFRNVAKTKTVLYLAGEEALDIESATSKGFCRDNMIGIDIRENAVKSVRGMRAIALQGNLCDVLVTWPKDWRIDVLVADLCCGFTVEVMRLHAAMYLCKGLTRESVFSMNLQRGRDSETNYVRKAIGEKTAIPKGLEKHRGAQFLWWRMWSDLVNAVRDWGLSPDRALAISRNILVHQRAVFNSYHRPGSPVFDSFVSRWISSTDNSDRPDFTIRDIGLTDKKIKCLEQQKRKIVAARAIRSSRIN